MRYLLATLLIAIQISAFADCELFKEEVNVIGENIREMYSDLYDANAFVEKAKTSKSESDNQKLGRYLQDIKGDVDLIEHGMSQLKLHQDCACENFKFQYVDNLLIEIKFWLKKAQSVDLAKPKKTDYDGIKSNSDKALAKASDLQVYFMNPCKESKQEEMAQPEPAPPAAQAEIADTSNNEAMAQVEEESMEKAAAIEPVTQDTSSTNPPASDATDKSTTETTPEATGDSEMAAGNDESATDNGSAGEIGSSATGAVIGTAAAVTTGAVVAATQAGKDSSETKEEEPPQEIALTENEESTSMDSTELEEPAPIADVQESSQDTSTTLTDVGSPDEESETDLTPAIDGSAVAAGVILAQVEDSTQVEETELEEEVQVQPIMDTVRHKDVSVAVTSPDPEPVVEEQDTIKTEPTEVPVSTTPSPDMAPAVATPAVVAIPSDFHYAVQIATGKADTKSGKFAALNEDIYSVEEGGLTKYRIGKYKTLSEAKATKNKAFNGGFLDAFIVAYSQGKRIGLGEARQMEAGNAPIASAPKNATEEAKPVKVKRKSDVVLAIQIGANLSSTDPVYEIVKYERKVGMDVHVLHGSPIRFYTSPTTSQDEVETNLGRIKSKGINEAFLIGIVDGKRIDYAQALEFLKE